MGFLDRLFRRRPAGPSVRPESLRSVLLMAGEGEPEPDGDPMELVMRAFNARNRELFAAVFRRELWEQIQLGFGTFSEAQRKDAAQLAELVRRSHGDEVGAFVQEVAHPLRAGAAPSSLTLLIVYRPTGGSGRPGEITQVEGALLPLLDLTSPIEGRAR